MTTSPEMSTLAPDRVSRDPPGHNGSGGGERSRWSAALRVMLEFVLLFAIAVLAKEALVALAGGSYPNPLWLPVVVLSLQYGLALGIGAAVIAAGIEFSEGLPPQLMTEDLYGYIGRIAAEPVAWCCVALLVGHIRTRQLTNTRELEAELVERDRQCQAVADLCTALRLRTELLERHIAADAQASSVDVAEVLSELHRSGWEDFPERLTAFVKLMTGSRDFSVYLLRDGALALAFQTSDWNRLGAAGINPEDPVFTAVVRDGRLVSSATAAEAAIVANRWSVAAPLLEPQSKRVIGMLAVSGGALDGYPGEVERRFALIGTEISRLIGRIGLLECWRTAGGADEVAAADGQLLAGKVRPLRGRASPAGADRSSPQGERPSNRKATLQ